MDMMAKEPKATKRNMTLLFILPVYGQSIIK